MCTGTLNNRKELSIAGVKLENKRPNDIPLCEFVAVLLYIHPLQISTHSCGMNAEDFGNLGLAEAFTLSKTYR